MKTNCRIFRWHHWSGLVVGIFLMFTTTTGAIIVFSDEYENYNDRSWKTVENTLGIIHYDRSFFKLRESFPEWEIRIYEKPRKNEALIYELRKKEERKRAYAHPVNGKIIHISDHVENHWYRQLFLFHYTLLSGTTGKIIVLLVGITFLITLLTGLYVYRRSLLKVFQFRVAVRNRNRRSLYSSLHRIIGVWGVFFNLLIAITGLSMAGQVIANSLKQNTAKKVSANIRSVDSIIATAQRFHHDFQVHMIRVRANNNTVQLSGRFRDDPWYYGRLYSSLTFDGSSARLISTQELKNQPMIKKLLSMSGPLHFGNWGGLFVKIIYCMFGLIPSFLSISGFVIWASSIKIKP